MPIVGDARYVIDDLIGAVAAEHKAGHGPTSPTGGASSSDIRERYPLGWEEPPDGTLSPQYVIKRLGEIAGPDAIYVAGVGQHQMWASQFISYESPGPGSTPAGPGRWGTPCRPPWARRWASPTPSCGPSTATAASR